MSPMKFESISQVIEIIGLAQGLIIGCYFILKRNNKEIKLLGLFLLCFSAPFIAYIIRETGLLKNNPSLFFLPVGFYFMAIPLYFLYVENIIYKIKKTVVLKHLSFGIIEFSILLVLYLMPVEKSVPLFYRFEWLYNFTYAYVLNFFCLSYLAYILWRLKAYNEKYLQMNSDYNINVSWLQKTSILLVVLYSFEFIASNVIILDIYKEIIYISDSIMATVFIYWISIFGIKNRSIVKLDANIPKNGNQKNEELEESEYLKLKELVLKEKLFKNTNLNIYILSEVSGISNRKISQLINYFHKNNFNSFINSFRINEAKEMINSSDFEHYTIEAIAKEAGFNSKSSFNTYFKNSEGITPTAYKSIYKIN
jgi:AraC-like DNA-binding protein